MNAPEKTILVVEDEVEILTLIARFLSNAGYGTLLASDALQALAISENSVQSIDVIVSDYNLPKFNGIDLADKIRETRPEVGLILISANAAAAELLDGRGTFLPKPVNFDDLLRAIEKAFH
jgi:DNA-binding NtrC family response regulator